MGTLKTNLTCPICRRRIRETLHIPKIDIALRGIACQNEFGAHIGFVYYKFTNISEATEKPEVPHLILN